MDFKPNGERLLVKTTEGEQVSEGGFIIPDSEKAVSTKVVSAKVVVVGDLLSYDLIGKTVYFKEGDGSKLTLESANYIVLDNKNILGFV